MGLRRFHNKSVLGVSQERVEWVTKSGKRIPLTELSNERLQEIKVLLRRNHLDYEAYGDGKLSPVMLAIEEEEVRRTRDANNADTQELVDTLLDDVPAEPQPKRGIKTGGDI